MSKTSDIKTALLADLAAITQANGYNVTVSEALDEPKDISDARNYGVYLVPGPGGTSEPETFSEQYAVGAQEFVAQLIVMGVSDPNNQMDLFTDDVRNAVENTSSNLAGALSGQVVWAAATEWTEVLTSEELSQGVYFREVTIQVRYAYQRGAL